jgi:hypothetical protein
MQPGSLARWQKSWRAAGPRARRVGHKIAESVNLPAAPNVNPLLAGRVLQTRPETEVEEIMMTTGDANIRCRWNTDAARAGSPSAYPLRL